MELYLFRHETWKQLYSCDYLNESQWDSHRVPRVAHGAASIIFSTVAIALYVPCLIVMKRKEFFGNTCYKIMFYLGIIDIISQCVDGFINGYLLIIGAEFCTMPHFIYITGTLPFSTWCVQCGLCLLLAVNRMCDMWGQGAINRLFSGYRTHFWCCLSWVYGIVMMFTPPSLVFVSSIGGSWFYDPYIGYDIPGIDHSWYWNHMMGIDNLGVSLLLFILYSAMLIKLYFESSRGSQLTSNMQRSIFIQAAFICFLSAIPAVIYLYMQFFYTPEWLIAVGHFAWQGSNAHFSSQSETMELYLFRHETWKQLYSCDYLNESQWDSHRVPRVAHGAASIIFSTVAIALYVPCLIVMKRKEFFGNTCYKIMFYLGIIDIISQCVDGFINGYLLIIGAEFCTMPHFIYITGTLPFSTWCVQCGLCLLLAVNRFCDIWGKSTINRLFSGYRTHFWCCLSWVYGIVMMFTPPSLVFVSSIGGSWFYDPYIGYDIPGIDHSWYFNYMMGIDNLGISLFLFVLYAGMVGKLYIEGKKSLKFTSEIQRSIFFQAAFICFLSAIPAVIYLYMQFFYTPEWLIAVGHFAWQGSNGGPAFIYMIFNMSLRRKVLEMFGIRFERDIQVIPAFTITSRLPTLHSQAPN
ncbi:hypothetical protein QR680_015734 [Steinernema hermaphroditum]|uniref:Uncharacterized protein n=1 Tax=Steinernema hermaphroditum TaxID=289476 RepID=A0AA39LKR2_9BILA|nr:hypothetical protein QR680_015734 [Steinernema hermaphroditum]